MFSSTCFIKQQRKEVKEHEKYDWLWKSEL